MLAPVTCRPRLGGQSGLTLVELMVAMTIGLFVVAAGSALVVQHVHENRRLLLEARLMQDLRVTADLLGRNLRRAGHWGDASAGLWRSNATAQPNPYLALSPQSGASDAIAFHYSRDDQENHQLDSQEAFGFRLRQGVVEMRIGAGQWQAVSDPGVIEVTAFTLTPTVQEVSLDDFCPKPCPPGASACPPRHQVRSVQMHIEARATHDAQVRRSLSSQVRLRNDALSGACAH